MGYPRARLLELGAHRIRDVSYEDTEHFRVTRDFLMRRDRILRELLAAEETPREE